MIFAVDGLCQDPCASRLAHPPGSAEKKGMRQLVLEDGVLEGGGDMRLPYDRGEILRTVFSGGNDEVVHTDKVKQIGLRM